MVKYGRGLNREIVGAVNGQVINEPFAITDIRNFASTKSWNIPDNYINACLTNGASLTHSLTYKKYFISLGDGKYKVDSQFRGVHWI
ncbi:hypothetical protein [Bacillus sp. FJAT-49736]|uniref:hypothetical protein n=1 Tax=Bacillus sp. FJAT-49736 TaxID=2833582 RepID=UPI001BC9EFF4|nr:hypothetical protein [Bacillus sp. FJAT-49736]MBS4171827.1 hypothetical protein [Bacillus sp. FJAT-49736]